MNSISPKDHPNAFVGLSTASVTAFLVSEAKKRLGFDLSVEEAGYIVAAAVAVFLFAGRRLGGNGKAPPK